MDENKQGQHYEAAQNCATQPTTKSIGRTTRQGQSTYLASRAQIKCASRLLVLLSTVRCRLLEPHFCQVPRLENANQYTSRQHSGHLHVPFRLLVTRMVLRAHSQVPSAKLPPGNAHWNCLRTWRLLHLQSLDNAQQQIGRWTGVNKGHSHNERTL